MRLSFAYYRSINLQFNYFNLLRYIEYLRQPGRLSFFMLRNEKER